MSAEENVVQERVTRVLEAAAEPSYLSEIARRLNKVYDDDITVKQVAQAVSVLVNNDRVEVTQVGYTDNGGQSEGSKHFKLSPGGGLDETTEWEPHSIVSNPGVQFSEIDEPLREELNPTISVPNKAQVVDVLSGGGNQVSRDAENIMQDSLERQFRHYAVSESPEYNDPGLDFWVVDDAKRNFGLAVEITTRYENPVGEPYLKSKKDKALEKDLDLVILGPQFTQTLRGRFENKDDDRWHSDAEGQITHLHKVPNDRPDVWTPFALDSDNDDSISSDGFPIIVQDDDRVTSKLGRTGHVGPDYPVVTTDRDNLLTSLDAVNRDYVEITESRYRNQIRESIEPLLHEFTKPYRIEQYLVDTYWDKGLSTNDIGRAVGVSGRTIRRWMDERHWDIVTRGTGTPISQETVEIWKRMYLGQEPFPDDGMTGYEVKYNYNQHPYFSLDDWREWYSKTQAERDEIIVQQSGAGDDVSYLIMLGSNERIFPSYSFIIETLRREGVEIREGFFGDSAFVTPTAKAIRYMLNSGLEEVNTEGDADQRDLTKMRSSFEVEFGEWASENEIPYGYEPFQVPSKFDDSESNASTINELIDSVGRDEALTRWRRIYNKHTLDSEGDVGIEEGFDMLSREFIVPDFTLHPLAENEEKGPNWSGWSRYHSIIEIGGPYGVGIIDDWSSWYRVTGVAEKELAYKLMGIWNSVYFVIPDDEDIPTQVRDDRHYIIVSPTQLDAGFDKVKGRLGI